MDELIATHLSELIELVLATIGAGVFSIVGVRLESLAMQSVTSGQVKVAAWFFVAGAIALYVGVYALGVSEVIPRVSQMKQVWAQR